MATGVYAPCAAASTSACGIQLKRPRRASISLAPNNWRTISQPSGWKTRPRARRAEMSSAISCVPNGVSNTTPLLAASSCSTSHSASRMASIESHQRRANWRPRWGMDSGQASLLADRIAMASAAGSLDSTASSCAAIWGAETVMAVSSGVADASSDSTPARGRSPGAAAASAAARPLPP